MVEGLVSCFVFCMIDRSAVRECMYLCYSGNLDSNGLIILGLF